MPQGVVKEYDPKRGVGFIETEQGEELPVHRSELVDEHSQGIYAGDIVEFRIGLNRRGKRAALEVRRIGWEETADGSPREWSF